MNYFNIIGFIVSLVLSYIGSPMIFNMLYESKTIGFNYKNEKIPICMGLLFIFVQSITIVVINILCKGEIKYTIHYLFAFILIGIAGLLDDLIGDENIKGFKGHIKSFFKGKLTTGGIKAGIGFFVALFLSLVISKSLTEIIVNTLIIALFTNLTNLFDLRPGRSIKVFLLISVILLLTSFISEYNFILYSFYGILIIYFPLDLKAKSMMGDIGSNTLGLTLGVFCAFTHTLSLKLIYLLLLIVTHILAEKISFSTIIENNKVLTYLDKMGR